jgi:hypothetical protein
VRILNAKAKTSVPVPRFAKGLRAALGESKSAVTGAKDRAELPGWDSGAAPILIQSLHVTGP